MCPDSDLLVISAYDPAWPDQFAALSARAEAALGSLALRIEHVGSTAVAGLAAKPIIDLDVVIRSRADLPEVIQRLARLGYVHEGHLGIVGREAFLCPVGEPRHHLYVLAEEAPELQRHLSFRDALRSDPDLVNRYAALKWSLADRFPHDRSAYNRGKSEFVEAALKAWTGGAHS